MTINTRTKDPTARLEALKAKYVGRIYGDYRCVGVSLRSVENKRQHNNIPMLRLQCTACGAEIERRADRPFNTDCKAQPADCMNAKFNRAVRTYLDTLRKREQNADPEFMEFDNFRAWLISQGVKPGDTIRVRKIDPASPISAKNAQIWASNSGLRYKDPHGKYFDLRALAAERKVKYTTAVSRARAGETDPNKICPPVDKRLEKYTVQLDKPQSAVGLNYSQVLRFRGGIAVEYPAFARDFDLDPEKLSDIVRLPLPALAEKYGFSLDQLQAQSSGGKYRGEIAAMVIQDKRFAPVPWSETPYGKEWLRCDRRAKQLKRRQQEDEDFDPIEWQSDGQDDEFAWDGVSGSLGPDGNTIWEEAVRRVRDGIKPKRSKRAMQAKPAAMEDLDDPDGGGMTVEYMLDLMRWQEQSAREDEEEGW